VKEEHAPYRLPVEVVAGQSGYKDAREGLNIRDEYVRGRRVKGDVEHSPCLMAMGRIVAMRCKSCVVAGNA
jgi:hypothetical protein